MSYNHKKKSQKQATGTPPRTGLNIRDTTNQEPHDGPWFDDRGSNTGHQLVMPGGETLCHSCYETCREQIARICTDLTQILFLSPKNFTQAHLLKIKCLVADVTAFGSPDRAEPVFLGRLWLGVFLPINETRLVGN